MHWKHGYYAESGYTHGFYPETMPARLHWAALIQGHAAPLRGFRYLDAGCGQGLNLILAAAAHPDSEFVGIDFLPEHIAHARALAQTAGLGNVTFLEGDFMALARNPSALGTFDYAVCHGISTWVAPAVQQALFQLLGQVLKPGGLFYNSYNTYPGWLGVTPFQHMVLLEQRSKTGGQALKATQHTFEQLKTLAPAMFEAQPMLAQRMASMAGQDPAYLVQEYNNQFWQPLFVSQMIDAMAAVKLSYLGTATLPECSDLILPEGVRKLLAEQTSPALREQLRDYALNQNFRRDLYVKGHHRPWPIAQNAQVMGTRFCINPLMARPDPGKPYPIKGAAVELTGNATFYGRLLDCLTSAPQGASLTELVQAHGAQPSAASVMQAITLLLHGGWVLLDLVTVEGTAPQTNSRATSAAMAKAVCEGAPYQGLMLPRGGCAVPLNEVDWQMLHFTLNHAQGAHASLEQCIPFVAQGLQQLNRSLAQNGQAITDPHAQHKALEDAVQAFQNFKLPVLKAYGAL